jgi:hypothetical protein
VGIEQGRFDMGLMGDRFVGEFEGHRIELVRTNIDKKVVVTVDDYRIAEESVALPHSWEKEKEFSVGSCGKKHKLSAHSTLKKIFGFLPVDNEYKIEIDGQEVFLKKTE